MENPNTPIPFAIQFASFCASLFQGFGKGSVEDHDLLYSFQDLCSLVPLFTDELDFVAIQKEMGNIGFPFTFWHECHYVLLKKLNS